MKKKKLSLFVLLFVIAITGVFVVGTYAKYTSEISKAGTAQVAAWNFATDNAGTELTFGIPATADANTLVANRIAPGTSGSFTINVKNTSEVGADVTLALQSIENKPSNLKFYKTRTGEGTTASPYAYSNELTPGDATNGVITGKLAAGTTADIPVKFYWVWAYETTDDKTVAANDVDDTSDGETHANLSVTVKVTGTQIEPGTTVSNWGF